MNLPLFAGDDPQQWEAPEVSSHSVEKMNKIVKAHGVM
jgi:hypothetical protein